MWAGAPLRNAVRQGKECSKCQDESGGGGPVPARECLGGSGSSDAN